MRNWPGLRKRPRSFFTKGKSGRAADTARPDDLDCPTSVTLAKIDTKPHGKHNKASMTTRSSQKQNPSVERNRDMIAVIFMSIALVALLCVVAYTLAVYALPFMLGLTAAQFAYGTGSGLVGAILVGLFAAGAAFGFLMVMFDSLRSPVLRLIVALIFAVPAAIAGYALVHGVAREAVPWEIWRQIFCIIGGGVTGVSAWLKLVAPPPATPVSTR